MFVCFFRLDFVRGSQRQCIFFYFNFRKAPPHHHLLHHIRHTDYSYLRLIWKNLHLLIPYQIQGTHTKKTFSESRQTATSIFVFTRAYLFTNCRFLNLIVRQMEYLFFPHFSLRWISELCMIRYFYRFHWCWRSVF